MFRSEHKKARSTRSFSFSIFLIYSFGLLLTMIIVTVFLSVYISRVYSDMAKNYNSAVINRVTSETDNYLRQAVDMSSYPYVYKEWSEQMKNPPEAPHRGLSMINLVNIKKFDSSLLQMANSIVDYQGVYLFCENGLLLYSSSNLPSSYIRSCHQNQKYKETYWYEITSQADGGAVFLCAEQVTGEEEDVFYIARLVKDSARKREIGVYLMEIKGDYLASLCSSFVDEESESCMIFDPDGHIVAAAGKEIGLPEDFFSRLDSLPNEESISLSGGKYLVTHDTSRHFGLTICKFVPLSTQEQAYRVTLLTLIMFIILCLIFAFVMFFVLSKQITKPIEQLKEGMKVVESGNYDLSLQPTVNNELSELFISFNSMTARLKHLVEQVYVEEVQKKEAQIVALQSQINPHFLYNTLESIQIVAISNKDYLASRMISSLAKLFRYAVSSNEDVTLKSELDYIDEYITLQTIRFKDSFSFQASIPEELLDKPVMKLTLQPFVENCIQHGLRGMSDGLISLEARTVEHGFELSISDNGKGISTEALESIRSKLSQTSSYERIGIFNVNSRLRALYGPGSGVFIDSSPGKGTKVTIRVLEKGIQHE